MRGFTLVELLVAVAITVLLAGMILPNWRAGTGSLALERVAVKFSQDVRRASEFVLSARSYACPTGSISGYGVYVSIASPNSYILFADCNGNQQYDAGTDGVVETVAVEQGVKIASSVPTSFSMSAVPPDPIVFLKDEGGSGVSSATVIFDLENDPSQTQTVDINTKGVVSIQ